MTKFQDLLNGKIPTYSGAIIIPVEDAFTIDVQTKEYVEVTCPRLAEDNDVIEFAKIPRGYIAIGYPFFDGTVYRWRIRK